MGSHRVYRERNYAFGQQLLTLRTLFEGESDAIVMANVLVVAEFAEGKVKKTTHSAVTFAESVLFEL